MTIKSILLFTILFITACGSEKSNQKEYAKLGTYHISRYPTENLQDDYVVYYSKEALNPDMPVVIFLEGGGVQPHIDHYRGVMEFLASQGYFVIGAESGESYDSDFAKEIVTKALHTAQEAHQLNIDKLAIIGHSQGGGQAFYLMHYLQQPLHGGYGDKASLTLSIDGWFAFNLNQADLGRLKGDVAFIQMHGLQGTGTDPRIHLTIWNLAKQADKTFLTLPQNAHSYIAGDLPSLLQKPDILRQIGALTHDSFYASKEGYETIPSAQKVTYHDIHNQLSPKENYTYDCNGIAGGAREGQLYKQDIDYCALYP